MAIPVSLTSLFYSGSVVSRLLSFSGAWEQEEPRQESYLVGLFKAAFRRLMDDAYFVVLNILAWRNYVVVSIVCFLALCSSFSCLDFLLETLRFQFTCLCDLVCLNPLALEV